ncbi:hypothetical protein N8218_01550 [bacterium]|nr:hypothetical protein [bacterium]
MKNSVEKFVLVPRPPFGGENFDLSEAFEARFDHQLVDVTKLHATLSHHAAIEENVALVRLEVADVVGVEPAVLGGPLDLLSEIMLPPDVVDIEYAEGEDDSLEIPIITAFRDLGWHGTDEDGEYRL